MGQTSKECRGIGVLEEWRERAQKFWNTLEGAVATTSRSGRRTERLDCLSTTEGDGDEPRERARTRAMGNEATTMMMIVMSCQKNPRGALDRCQVGDAADLCGQGHLCFVAELVWNSDFWRMRASLPLGARVSLHGGFFQG